MMEDEDQEEDSKEPPRNERMIRRRSCYRYVPLWVVLGLLVGAGAIAWYFLGMPNVLVLLYCGAGATLGLHRTSKDETT